MSPLHGRGGARGRLAGFTAGSQVLGRMVTSRSCPLCPQVMETCQVSRSPRERLLLLLLLLLLVPWGTGPASGVALPLAGVFR